MKHRQLRTALLVILSIIFVATLGTAVGCNKAECTVTFSVDGGVTVPSMTVRQNSEIGELPVTSKDGYEFLGWTDVKGGSVNVDKSYVVTKDVTFSPCLKTFATSYAP